MKKGMETHQALMGLKRKKQSEVQRLEELRDGMRRDFEVLGDREGSEFTQLFQQKVLEDTKEGNVIMVKKIAEAKRSFTKLDS